MYEDLEPEEEQRVKNLTNTEDIKDFYEYSEECIKRIVNLDIPGFDKIENLQIDLPFEEELKTKKLAIFDLDETLVHCEVKNLKKSHVQIKVTLPSGERAVVRKAFYNSRSV